MLDDSQQHEICTILALGGTRRMAAEYVGCHIEAIRATAQFNPRFAEKLRKADFRAEITLLSNIQLAAKDVKQWRAAAWALERLFPERYARRRPETITRQQLAEIIRQLGTIVVEQVPVKRYRQRVLARLAELIAAEPPPGNLLKKGTGPRSRHM